MRLRLLELQPSELFLDRDSINFFLANRRLIWNLNPPIRIAYLLGLPFKYGVIEGNKRLFTLYLLGVKSLDIIPEEIGLGYEDEYSSSLKAYNHGIRSLSDLRRKIVSRRIYALNCAN